VLSALVCVLCVFVVTLLTVPLFCSLLENTHILKKEEK